jgi:tRNA/rRNA methyltransferase
MAGWGPVVGPRGRIGRGTRRASVTTVRSAASRLVSEASAGGLAVLFGPESDGLSLADLAACDEAIRIPQTRPGPSLNLAQAAAVIAYELFEATLVPGNASPPETVDRDHVRRMSRRMSRLARHCGLTVRNRPEQMQESLRNVFAAHEYTPHELSVLEQWLAQLEWFVGLPSIADVR